MHIKTEFTTQHSAMLNLLEMATRVAQTDVTVLIQGESGTGKELIARRIHEASQRNENRLVSINCGALQDHLLVSELFGHEKGAFTGAISQKKGLVEVADGGTLFLDEIGEMGLEAQAKLLRFLQEGELYRLGGKEPIHVSVRVLSATNKDLESMVKEGNFREDLFYRINTVSLQILPLRKRTGDVPLLIKQFLTDDSLGIPSQKEVSTRALKILSDYHWPGNVRELQNVVERFKILIEGGIIQEKDVPFNIRSAELSDDTFQSDAGFLLEGVERRHILKVLAHFEGNKTKAANAMGITVKTLYNKLARYRKERTQNSQMH